MLGLRKKGLKEGDFVFARQPDGEYNKIIFLVQLLVFRVQKLELTEL